MVTYLHFFALRCRSILNLAILLHGYRHSLSLGFASEVSFLGLQLEMISGLSEVG